METINSPTAGSSTTNRRTHSTAGHLKESQRGSYRSRPVLNRPASLGSQSGEHSPFRSGQSRHDDHRSARDHNAGNAALREEVPDQHGTGFVRMYNASAMKQPPTVRNAVRSTWLPTCSVQVVVESPNQRRSRRDLDQAVQARTLPAKRSQQATRQRSRPPLRGCCSLW